MMAGAAIMQPLPEPLSWYPMDSDDVIATELCTIRDYLRWAVSCMTRANVFFGHGTDNAWDEAVALVWHVAGLPFSAGETLYDARLAPHERRQILTLLRRRTEERMPLPYLTGEAWFAGLPFNVDERVIVPRSPVAELIEKGFEPWYTPAEDDAVTILDLCAGSGCIGIACAQYFPDALVDLVELSDDAIDIARSNIARHGVGERVRIVRSDLFSALQPQHQYSLIVSNPPYVDAPDMAQLPPEFHHEPRMSLASGEDGLDHARRILREAADYLAPGGLLVLEVGNSALALEQQYPQVPFTWVEFARGGDGVLVMTAEELHKYRGLF
jgi:ribosomal protein L3 glutamine methyltransferase